MITGSLSGNTAGIEVTSLSHDDRAKLANLREVFFTRDVISTLNILKSDIQLYVDKGDISRMKLVVLDELIPYFIKSICNVYDTAPLFKFAKDDKEGIDGFNELSKEVQLNRFLSETFERCRFHNTIIVYIRYNKELDKVFLENSWHAGNCEITTYEGYSLEMKKFGYLMDTEPNMPKYRIFWELLGYNADGTAKTEHYKVKLNKNGTTPKRPVKEPIGENNDITGPTYWPFVTYRYSERGRGYWGNAMDSVVELIRMINILLTITSDDTIQETIRILLLNFDPTGTTGEKGQLKTGMRHPISPPDQIGRDTMDGKILNADLYTDDVLKLVEGLWSIVSNTHNVGNVLKPDFRQAVSSLALRVQNEPVIRDWAHDINVVAPLDPQLVRKIVEVNNYHRDGKLGSKDKRIDLKLLDDLLIEYQEPHVVTDEKEEYAIEKQKWPDGTSSPLLYVMRKNPEMSEDEAKQYIKDNLKVTGELTGFDIEVEGEDEQKIIDSE